MVRARRTAIRCWRGSQLRNELGKLLLQGAACTVLSCRAAMRILLPLLLLLLFGVTGCGSEVTPGSPTGPSRVAPVEKGRRSDLGGGRAQCGAIGHRCAELSLDALPYGPSGTGGRRHGNGCRALCHAGLRTRSYA